MLVSLILNDFLESDYDTSKTYHKCCRPAKIHKLLTPALGPAVTGCYVDLDFEALKPLEGLLHNRTLALARMGNRTVEHKSHEHNVPNSFMCR